MGDSEVPSFFICPISLEIMKDPVIISTGITFDRESIEKWILTYQKTTCPVTKQILLDFTLTPNSNLLRLIQSWNSRMASSAIKYVDKKSQQDAFYVLLEEIKQPNFKVRSLRKIKSLIQEDYDSGRTYPGDDDSLFPIIAPLVCLPSRAISQFGGDHDTLMMTAEAVSTLCLLKPSRETLKMVSQNGNGLLVSALCSIMGTYTSNLQLRIQTAVLLNSIFKLVDGTYKEGITAEFFESITDILKDQNSKDGSIAVLCILMEILPFGKNKVLAIQGGCTPVLVELLAENSDKRVCEMILVVLEKLCRKAEGREAFLAHPLAIAAVLSKFFRVSNLANDKAIALFSWIFKSCKRGDIAQEFMEVGGVAKIRLLVENGCNAESKDKAREILGFHNWNNSPCFPSSFRADYIVSRSY